MGSAFGREYDRLGSIEHVNEVEPMVGTLFELDWASGEDSFQNISQDLRHAISRPIDLGKAE